MTPTASDQLPLVLAIDTSCDDTSVAVTQGVRVLSNVIASQTELHQAYGGVFPTVAKVAHRERIDEVVIQALREAGVDWDDITAIAVTQGPGLAPSLEVGITKAKALAEGYNLPLIAVNHIEGHALSPLAVPADEPANLLEVENVLSLVISGGHSDFILIKRAGEYQRLGWTVDDAAGEALDKVGRMLGLGYPAGAEMEKLAAKGNAKAYEFPLPMTTSGDYNLSFAGLKTAAQTLFNKIAVDGRLTKTQTADFCASFQYAVFRAICYKLKKILENYEVSELWLGGGVAANQELRRMLNEVSATFDLPPLKVPYSMKLCMDNAAMIGLVAGYSLNNALTQPELEKLERLPQLAIGS